MFARKLTALFTLVASVTYAPGLASGEGINCEGSSNCVLLGCDGGTGDCIDQLASQIGTLDPSTYFNAGDHISCTLNLCAFYQDTAGGTAGDAATHLNNLIAHGCTQCGSDPIDGVDVSNGMLTANWVSDCDTC